MCSAIAESFPGRRHSVVEIARTRELVRFAAIWAPYGGADDEIFTRFGLQPADFYRRVMQAVSAQPTTGNQYLLTHCVRKIRLHEAGRPPRRG